MKEFSKVDRVNGRVKKKTIYNNLYDSMALGVPYLKGNLMHYGITLLSVFQ